MFMLVTKDNMW